MLTVVSSYDAIYVAYYVTKFALQGLRLMTLLVI